MRFALLVAVALILDLGSLALLLGAVYGAALLFARVFG